MQLYGFPFGLRVTKTQKCLWRRRIIPLRLAMSGCSGRRRPRDCDVGQRVGTGGLLMIETVGDQKPRGFSEKEAVTLKEGAWESQLRDQTSRPSFCSWEHCLMVTGFLRHSGTQHAENRGTSRGTSWHLSHLNPALPPNFREKVFSLARMLEITDAEDAH